jgi:hypothetical protein
MVRPEGNDPPPSAAANGNHTQYLPLTHTPEAPEGGDDRIAGRRAGSGGGAQRHSPPIVDAAYAAIDPSASTDLNVGPPADQDQQQLRRQGVFTRSQAAQDALRRKTADVNWQRLILAFTRSRSLLTSTSASSSDFSTDNLNAKQDNQIARFLSEARDGPATRPLPTIHAYVDDYHAAFSASRRLTTAASASAI